MYKGLPAKIQMEELLLMDGKRYRGMLQIKRALYNMLLDFILLPKDCETTHFKEESNRTRPVRQFNKLNTLSDTLTPAPFPRPT